MKKTARSLTFVVFSDDWGEHPSSCQHLFKRISKNHPVVWVNTIGMRHPTLSWMDVKKTWQKIRRMAFVRRRARDRSGSARDVVVLQPPMLPYTAFGLIRWINRFSVSTIVRRALKANSISDPILVTTVPNASDFVATLGESMVVYYCVDDFSQWPGLEQDLIGAMEAQLIAKANVLIATSQKLYQKLITNRKPTHLLTHGVDLNLFSQDSPMEHKCLEGIPHPRVGYFGLIDRRSDQSLIAAVASEMREFSFVMTGPVATDITSLEAHTNIHFTGSLDYAELPALVKGLDALFIPYLVNDFTNSISPLKLKEYLVTGKPVIATPMAENILLGEYVTIASTLEEWKAALRSALSVDIAARRRSLLEVMADESWDNKAQLFLNICIDANDTVQSSSSAQ